MLVRDLTEAMGTVRIVKRCAITGEILEVTEARNGLTNGYFNLVRDGLSGAATDMQIKYMEIGSGTTAFAPTQTALITPTFRKQVTDRTDGGDGVLTTTVYLAPDEANDPIEEWGWFAGSGATATIGTGIMVARFLSSQDKNNLESFQVDRTDTITEAP